MERLKAGLFYLEALKEVRFSGSKEAKQNNLVAFSFDDGPHPEKTLAVVRLLNEEKIPATFFWNASNARSLTASHPDLFSEIIDQLVKGSHEVGLHAPYDYRPTLKTRLFGPFSGEEMCQAKQAIEELTGMKLRLYRPHILHLGQSLVYAKQMGLTTVFGDPFCYADAASEIKFQIKAFSNAAAGSIIIFHDGISVERRETYILEVLPSVIANLRTKRFRLTLVSAVL